MKKIAEIMEELGFRPEGSDAVKKAFVKNLIKQAQETEFSKEKVSGVGAKSTNDPDNYQQISLFDQKRSS